MKKFICILMLLLVTACTSATKYGSCIGIDDIEEKDRVYKISLWNAALGVIFVETLIVPLWVLAYEIKCPVNTKEVIKSNQI